MSDAAFREALEELKIVMHNRSFFGRSEDSHINDPQVLEAEARVFALYAARQGEVYYVGAWRLDGSDRDLPAVALDAPFKPGDKVRVTKVEEGQ